jgi:hypothetical protein
MHSVTPNALLKPNIPVNTLGLQTKPINLFESLGQLVKTKQVIYFVHSVCTV